jgi:hypothetical protein
MRSAPIFDPREMAWPVRERNRFSGVPFGVENTSSSWAVRLHVYLCAGRISRREVLKAASQEIVRTATAKARATQNEISSKLTEGVPNWRRA